MKKGEKYSRSFPDSVQFGDIEVHRSGRLRENERSPIYQRRSSRVEKAKVLTS